MEFRLLRADEIDARISMVNKYGVGILLYKDARCDMNILDETVGVLNWQRHHTRENANCVVSIWDKEKKQWIEKEDTGTESYTEKEKGLASDSFKRACFNLGIGRELYTAPNMFVKAADLSTLKESNGRWTCNDFFKVTEIQYIEKSICYVKILNTKTNKYIEFGTPSDIKKEVEKIGAKKISDVKVKALLSRLAGDGITSEIIMKLYKVEQLKDLTETQHANIHEHWGDIVAKAKEGE